MKAIIEVIKIGFFAMSSNIRIKKKCENCQEEFVAKTIHTRYCSHTCNRKHYNEKKRKAKLKSAKNNNVQKTISFAKVDWISLQSKSYLTVKETAILLKMSTKTVYRLILLNLISFGLGSK